MECRNTQHQWWLTDCFGAIDRVLAIGRILEQGDSKIGRQIGTRRDLVRRWRVCRELPGIVPAQLFRCQPADALHKAAFNLAEIYGWIERITTIVDYVDT